MFKSKRLDVDRTFKMFSFSSQDKHDWFFPPPVEDDHNIEIIRELFLKNCWVNTDSRWLTDNSMYSSLNTKQKCISYRLRSYQSSSISSRRLIGDSSFSTRYRLFSFPLSHSLQFDDIDFVYFLSNTVNWLCK